VKTIISGSHDEKHQNMFDREVRIFASVNHPTLLGFRGWVPLGDDCDSQAAILTEFMANGSLQDIIKAKQESKHPPEWNETRTFIALYGTAIGMMVLHSRRIMHRDLKPGNILLNDDFEPKIANFGLSKLVKAGESMMLTSSLGTPHFMAPEMLADESYGFPVDV
jgi:serine/threonine protein kinase